MALPDVDSLYYACHKHFKSEDQADELMADWIEAYLGTMTYEGRKQLHAGWKPAIESGPLIVTDLEAPHNQHASEIERAMEQAHLQVRYTVVNKNECRISIR